MLTGGAITCNAASACPAGVLSQTARNNRMATLVASSIAARSGITGITANSSSNTVTLTATATGPALNNTAVTVVQNGITVGGTLAFAGGADAATGSMGLTITALGDKVVQNPNFSGPECGRRAVQPEDHHAPLRLRRTAERSPSSDATGVAVR